MKKFLIGMLLLFCNINVEAQNEADFKSPAIVKLVNEADECLKNKGDNCDQLLKEAAALAKKSKQDSWSQINHKLCMYYFRTNRMDSVWKYIEIGLKNSENEDDYDALLNLKSQILYNQGASDSAIKVMIMLANRLEKTDKKDKLAYTYANVGVALYAQDDYEKSIVYLEKSFRILETINDSIFITTVAGNLADGYYSLHNDSLANHWAYKTLNLKKTSRGYEGQILAYMTLAKTNSKTNVDSALYFCKKAITLAENNNDKEKLGNVYSLYADNLLNANKLDEAQVQIEKAIKSFREITFLPGLAKALQKGGVISLKNRLFERSASYFNESISLNDSLKSETKFKTISELTIKYETEKKERQLAEQQLLIEKKNALLRNWMIIGALLILGGVFYYAQLRKSQRQKLRVLEQENENAVLKAIMNGEEQERNRISNDLHDGVAAMLGAAKMSLHSIPFLAEEKKNEQLDKVATIIGNTHADIRRIAHDLLPITLQREGFIAAINQFAADMNQMGLLELKIDNQLPADFSLPKRTELMLYRIIQELINNVIKHSHATESVILLLVKDHQLTIAVDDNGTGFVANRESQGLFSIKERLHAIGGEFEIGKKSNQGTRASLTFNLDKMS